VKFRLLGPGGIRGGLLFEEEHVGLHALGIGDRAKLTAWAVSVAGFFSKKSTLAFMPWASATVQNSLHVNYKPPRSAVPSGVIAQHER